MVLINLVDMGGSNKNPVTFCMKGFSGQNSLLTLLQNFDQWRRVKKSEGE